MQNFLWGLFAGVAIMLLVIWGRTKQPAPIQDAPSSTTETRPVATQQTTAVDHTAEVNRLRAQLAAEKQARQGLEAEVVSLRQNVAVTATNSPSGANRILEMAKRAGAFLPVIEELEALARRDRASLTSEEKRRLLQLQREHAAFLGALPEITALQNSPDDYGRFFRNMFQEAGGLTDPQAEQVEAFMRQRGSEMVQLGLNAAKEPTDPQAEEAWEERRDQFNEQTAHSLQTILPPGAAEKIGLGPALMEFLEMDFDKLSPSK